MTSAAEQVGRHTGKGVGMPCTAKCTLATRLGTAQLHVTSACPVQLTRLWQESQERECEALLLSSQEHLLPVSACNL